MTINFIDIETSGLDPAVHQVIEVGVVTAMHRTHFADNAFSLPFDETAADPRALEINGWGKREFAEQLAPELALDVLEDLFAVNELFCSWHVAFDESFLSQFFRRFDRKPPWSHRRVIDLPSLVLGRAGVIGSGASRLLMPQLGLDPDFAGRHGALADARANFEVYKRLNLWEMEV